MVREITLENEDEKSGGGKKGEERRTKWKGEGGLQTVQRGAPPPSSLVRSATVLVGGNKDEEELGGGCRRGGPLGEGEKKANSVLASFDLVAKDTPKAGNEDLQNGPDRVEVEAQPGTRSIFTLKILNCA